MVVLVAVVATVGVVVLRSGDADATVSLEAAARPGTDPFSASVATGPAVSFPPAVVATNVEMRQTLPKDPTTGTLTATGTTPGLYGGTNDTHLCNATQLVSYLAAHPDKATAWAAVLGIRKADIASYVARLTPVALTSDTRVTNHGYRNGHATTLQSVLQAGTAVMVDATGTPRVKCNCGNPLTPPEPLELSRATTTGTAWRTYRVTSVTVVRSTSTTTQLTLTDIHTGRHFTQPVGSGGLPDGTYDLDWTLDPNAPCNIDDSTNWRFAVQGTSVTFTVGAEGGDRSGTVSPVGSGFRIRAPWGEFSGSADSDGRLSGTGSLDGGVEDPGPSFTTPGPSFTSPEPTSSTTSSVPGAASPGPSFGSSTTGACTFRFTARRVSGGGTSPSATTTTTTTAPTSGGATGGSGGISGLPAGLKCKDLHDRGFSYADAADYWKAHGRPALMDADGNGIPCETVYPASDVTAYWGGGTAPSGRSAGPECSDATLAAAADDPSISDLGDASCDGPWAVASASVRDATEVDDITLVFHWNGSRWEIVDRTTPCETGQIPPSIYAHACQTN